MIHSPLLAGMVGQQRLVDQLEQSLRAASAQGCWLGLHGIRGLGKTTVAKALCARLEHGPFPTRTCLLEFPTLETADEAFTYKMKRDMVEDAQAQFGLERDASCGQASLDRQVANCHMKNTLGRASLACSKQILSIGSDMHKHLHT